MKKISLPAILLLSFLFITCDSDDNNPGTGSLTVTMDNTEFMVSNPEARLDYENMFGIEARYLTAWGHIDNSTVSIQIRNLEMQNPPDDAVFTKEYINIFSSASDNSECVDATDSFKLCEGGEISVSVDHGWNAGVELYSPVFDNSVNTFIDITSCNGKYASGKFQAKMVSDRGNEMILSGTFEDILYRIRK